MKAYNDLEIYKESFELAVLVHKLTLKLPKTELFELGSQVRRSAQSIRANIVEGYGRREYKKDFIRFLIIADASLLETESHLKMLHCLYQQADVLKLLEQYERLGKQVNSFIAYVEKNWKSKY